MSVNIYQTTKHHIPEYGNVNNLNLTQFSSAGSIMLCADDAIFVPVLQA
jgi:hypothetical protein